MHQDFASPVAAGDFLQSVPPGCDAYILRNVLQDWSDEQAHTILTRCHRAMSDRGTLLLIGRLLEPGHAPHPSKFTDMTMMVLTGGRERTTEEIRALLSCAGFVVGSVTTTRSTMAVIEARPDGFRT